MKSRIAIIFLQAFSIALPLVGCQQHEKTVQLQAWIAAQKKQNATVPAPLSTTPSYLPFVYRADADSAPFGRGKPKTPAIFNTRPAQRAAVQPLENFPLESIQMIGTISQEDRRHVLLQVDKLVYQARPGDYMGQNFGAILAISDNEISVEELIPGVDGRWETRITTMALRGTKK